MPGLNEIKRRIKSIKNIQQITKAMKMVAASKVKKVQGKVLAFRPYAERIEEVLEHLISEVKGDVALDPILKDREVKTIGLVVVTSDKGLCGSYNANLVRFAKTEIENLQSQGYNVKLWLVGNKSFGPFKFTELEIINKYSQIPQIPTIVEAKMLKKTVLENFLNGNVDKVVFAYTKFVSMVQYKPSLFQLIPISEENLKKQEGPRKLHIFEPNANVMIKEVLPWYIENEIYHILLESSASELVARMMAMSSATDNAKDILDHLTLVYNKARQAGITKEINEVVSGANALSE